MLHVFIYRFLLWLLFPAVVAFTIAIALRDGSARYLAQRLGCLRAANTATRPLWIHCASVGETNTALILVKAWLNRHPDDAFTFTTNTITAARVLAAHARKAAHGQIRHYYLPLDYPLFCRRFLNVVKPRCALIMETEIWLNLFSECRSRNIPLLIINARLSQQTLNGGRRFKSYYRQSLAAATRILARNEQDAAAFTALGAKPDTVETVGNLKQAAPPADADSLPNLINRRYLLAASTHEDEEMQAARAWRRALASGNYPENPLLVIAPRHPQRGRTIAQQLKKQGFQVRLKSHDPLLQENTDVYIADTIGELPALIRHADLVFMGGSLTPIGGHNVFEPAQLGVPQVVGPHTHNVRKEVMALKAAGALLEAADENALEKVFRAALDKAPEQADAAQKALALVRGYEDIADTYVTQIERAVSTY